MRDEIWEVLRGVLDPELGLNIVELGLVYAVHCEQESASIEMTMTTPACPMSGYLKDEARAAILKHFPGLKTTNVNLVWAPAWKPEMMTSEAKRKLGWSEDEIQASTQERK